MNLAEQVLKEILKEEANVAYVSDAIKKKYEVELNYQADDDKKGSGKRIIQPVALGHSTKGNLVLRAFQPYGDTKTKIPKWKLFRISFFICNIAVPFFLLFHSCVFVSSSCFHFIFASNRI